MDLKRTEIINIDKPYVSTLISRGKTYTLRGGLNLDIYVGVGIDNLIRIDSGSSSPYRAGFDNIEAFQVM